MFWAVVFGILGVSCCVHASPSSGKLAAQKKTRGGSKAMHKALCDARSKTVILIPQEELGLSDDAMKYYPASYNSAVGSLISSDMVLTSYDVGRSLGAEVVVASDNGKSYIARLVYADAVSGLAWFKLEGFCDTGAFKAAHEELLLGTQLYCVYMDGNGCKKAVPTEFAGYTYAKLLSGSAVKGLLVGDKQLPSGSVVTNASGKLIAVYAEAYNEDGTRGCVPIVANKFEAATGKKYHRVNARFERGNISGVNGLKVLQSAHVDLHTGDVVTHVNGAVIHNGAHAEYLLQEKGEVNLRLVRDEKEVHVNLKSERAEYLEPYFNSCGAQVTCEMLGLAKLSPQVLGIVKEQMSEVACVRYIKPGSPFIGVLEKGDLVLSVNNVVLGSRADVIEGLDTSAELIASGQRIVICVVRCERGEYVVKYAPVRNLI